jgi:hypothetical protein
MNLVFILCLSKYINLRYQFHFHRKSKENATVLLPTAYSVSMTPQSVHVDLSNDTLRTPLDYLRDFDDTLEEQDLLEQMTYLYKFKTTV